MELECADGRAAADGQRMAADGQCVVTENLRPAADVDRLAAPDAQTAPADDPACAVCPAALDYLYNTVDKLYYEFARDCGLSTCAFWMLYDLYRADHALPLQQLNETWAFSKQTINSALKTLEAKGLVAFAYVEGSRKSKRIALTEEGTRFGRRHMQPAIDAEARAFSQLAPEEGRELLHLIKKYTQVLSAEMELARSAGTARKPDCDTCQSAPCGEEEERV